ncbi:MAG: FprA family A-type flavoprotein [Muribaculaceae bacterium]
MNIAEISHNIFYVGVNDRTSSCFEGLWALPLGVSYNSYIIKGSDKIALIDTVHVSQSIKFINNITNIIGNASIDYLIINHMEPDHSGSIQIIKDRFPNIKIIGNNKTADMIKGFYGITDNVVEIKDRETIDLGAGKILDFIMTPMIHWPETMMTYERSSASLFSGDAFGCFGALNGGIVDDEMDIEPFIPEMYRYYSNIVAKYSNFVQKALAKIKDIKLDYICSTHGPVWHGHLNRIMDIYDTLSKNIGENGVVIAYGSMYGNTEEVVDVIARQLAEEGIKTIKIYNLSNGTLSHILSDICRYKGVIVGGPTYSNGVFPPLESLLFAMQTRELKNKLFATFGSYTWAPGITKKIMAYTEKMSLRFLDSNIEMKQSINSDKVAEAKLFAKSFANELRLF